MPSDSRKKKKFDYYFISGLIKDRKFGTHTDLTLIGNCAYTVLCTITDVHAFMLGQLWSCANCEAAVLSLAWSVAYWLLA